MIMILATIMRATSTWERKTMFSAMCSNRIPWTSARIWLQFWNIFNSTQRHVSGIETSLILESSLKKLHGLSPRANYTDRATAACRRSDCQLVWIEGATWSEWWIPPAVYSRFFRQEPLLFYQVAPHEAECTPFQTHYFFFLVVPGIEPGPPDL
jgi:hypothetical protein